MTPNYFWRFPTHLFRISTIGWAALAGSTWWHSARVAGRLVSPGIGSGVSVVQPRRPDWKSRKCRQAFAFFELQSCHTVFGDIRLGWSDLIYRFSAALA